MSMVLNVLSPLSDLRKKQMRLKDSYILLESIGFARTCYLVVLCCIFPPSPALAESNDYCFMLTTPYENECVQEGDEKLKQFKNSHYFSIKRAMPKPGGYRDIYYILPQYPQDPPKADEFTSKEN